eukprot:TRINITY_DN22466_c0_g1_i3.p2 TRINITY_DN22466_c0_g1~~TRINITY_DN22466_c0_g1_i3.p2  ORF type:complete len:547 (+),score=136.44 TRINITY_DN22466_c0_g1_i3:1262-2902(+)
MRRAARRSSVNTANKKPTGERLSGRKRTAASRSAASSASPDLAPTPVVSAVTSSAPADPVIEEVAPALENDTTVSAVSVTAPSSSPAGRVFDPHDYSSPIPVGHKVYARLKQSAEHYPAVVLERRSVKEEDEANRHMFRYYVHYVECDRRMDCWIKRDQIILQEELDDEDGPEYDVTQSWEEVDAARKVAAAEAGKKSGRSGADDAVLGTHDETHDAHTQVKNIQSIVLGQYEMEAWYFSPFPVEYCRFEKLYFCEFCLAFFGVPDELKRHVATKCKMRHPPGDEIYRSQEHNVLISVFEVDGLKEKVYCQNLCLIAKLFLDHKTLQYDVDAFIFYVLTEVDGDGCHLVGYFSKEKDPDIPNNLACILNLPCHQRKGYGKFLISLSYELSKLENKPGGPERPLSDLGRVSYESFWKAKILDLLKDPANPSISSTHGGGRASRSRSFKEETEDNGSGGISIDDIGRATGMLETDIRETLEKLDLLKMQDGEMILEVPKALMDKHLEKVKAEQKLFQDPNAIQVRPCDPSKLIWTPYLIPAKKKRKTG